MNTLKDLFSRMNDVDFPYVVLRNFDGLPYDCKLGEHSDLDLLVYDLEHWRELFPMAKPQFEYPRVRMRVPVGDSYVYCDIRHTGDDYYPVDFERNILNTREYNERGFFTPNPLMHTVALAYHAVHHKNVISKDYRRWLGDAKIEELLEVLKKSSVGWVKPKDQSVGSFNGYWKGATSVVSREGGKIVKTQVDYNEYELIRNEYEILARVSSPHFPDVYEYEDKKIIMEDCGEPILTNLPPDWREQLIQILRDLQTCEVTHRDIKLDNLMVKDGVIHLIDFGWAKFIHETDELEVPSCLGFPNRPSYGFDDSYSMNRVIKQIEYQLEDKEVAA